MGLATEHLIFMARSLKKGPFVESYLLEKIDKMNSSGAKKPIKTWSRRSMVTPDFVGHTFLVHNGKIFIPSLSPKTWSVTNSVNFRRRACLRNMVRTRRR